MEQDTRISKETVELCKALNFPHFFSLGHETWQATQTSVQKWLREVHKIHISIEVQDNARTFQWEYELTLIGNYEYHDEDCWHQAKKKYGKLDFPTYEEALEQGLIITLNLIKNETIS